MALVNKHAGVCSIGAVTARSAGGFVVFEGGRFGLVLWLDRFDRLVLLRRNFRLDLDGFDFDESRRLVDAFIVGVAPSSWGIRRRSCRVQVEWRRLQYLRLLTTVSRPPGASTTRVPSCLSNPGPLSCLDATPKSVRRGVTRLRDDTDGDADDDNGYYGCALAPIVWSS